ncbi:hypothetical protein NDA16_002853 [Ustilago loliicola]|nr:hypothetical protein NDA16_002853 [Ustilago loliicola]
MSGTVAPDSCAAVRVDELSDGQIRTYLDSYPASIWRRCQDTPRRLYFHKYKNGADLVQLDTLYYYHSHRSANDSAPWHSKDSNGAQQYVMELVSWSLLRSSGPNISMKSVKANSDKECQKVLDRAAEFLTVHNAKLRSSVQVTAVTVEGCMQILCELQGVGVREASAIVAAWTRYGVYMSEELVSNLLGAQTEYEDTWNFWRRFYEQAIEALKTKKYKSGREMEKVAWRTCLLTPVP